MFIQKLKDGFHRSPTPVLDIVRKIYYGIPSTFALVRRSVKVLVYLRKFPKGEKIREISYLPVSISAGIREVLENREIHKKIQDSYFQDRLVIVIAIPKSGSLSTSNCVAEMMPIPESRLRTTPNYIHSFDDSDLRPELVMKSFPTGGILQRHTQATGKNLHALYFLGVKYIILLRHPVDQLTAMYCQIRGNVQLKRIASNNHLIFHRSYPLHTSMFQAGVTTEETLRHMICDGYLDAVLSWIVDWVRFRDQNRSFLVRYEDFVRDRNKTLNNLSLFLAGKELDNNILMRCTSIINGYKKSKTKNLNTKKYPFGWTGKIGTWKDYFSEKNKEAYRSVVKGFLSYYPHASLLLDVYPNLLDIDNLESERY